MLYYLFQYLDQFNLPAAGVFRYISFRAAMAMILSLVVTVLFGDKLIEFLRNKQVKETVRDLGLEGEKQKAGTPTMGGIIIIAAIIIPTILFARFDNIYIILLLITTVWLGLIGFADDYIKVFKHDKRGLRARTKIFGQVSIGLLLGIVMYLHPDVRIRADITDKPNQQFGYELNRNKTTNEQGESKLMVEYKDLVTTVPFLKNYELDYGTLFGFLGNGYKWACLFYIPFIIFIVTAVSNAANFTDGIDGLAAGSSAIIGTCLGIFAYCSGNVIFSDYLNIMYLPDTGELVVFSAAFIGATAGFLWYNAFPAQIFMGDTGSLTIGGIIATLAIVLRKELLIPILCGIFLIENLSVVLQISWFKYTRKKYGTGRRIFLMAPLHHHFQKKGIHESKIVTRFWLSGLFLAIITFATLKLR